MSLRVKERGGVNGYNIAEHGRANGNGKGCIVLICRLGR